MWKNLLLYFGLLVTGANFSQCNEMEEMLNYIESFISDNITNDLPHRAGRFFHENLKQSKIQFPNLYGDPILVDNEMFDFIIIGSGSAGTVLANRLSEIENWKILLLEEGEEANFFTDIAPLAPYFQFTNYNWNYLMERQPNMSLGLEDGKMAWPRGRALGGTSIINYMIHVRGNRLDYDQWAAMGNTGWSYDELLPYFKKSEDFNVEYQDAGYHHKGGYLTVSDVPFKTQSVHAFVKAAQEAGHPYVDYNGRDQLGVSYVHSTTRRGLRCSGEKAFLRPIRHRRNLKISTRSRVTKIIIDPKTKEATGVKYIKNRQVYTAHARREVILSAGALNSPQILMLSGIGPRSHLEELGIPVIQDLPVGRKLYDHLTFLGLAFTVNESITLDQDKAMEPQNLLRLFLNGDGPLTTLGGVEALGYIKTSAADYTEAYPDMELIYIGAGLQVDRGQIYRRVFRVTHEIYDAVFKPLEKRPAFQVFPMLVHPRSFGYIELKSKNPYHWPKFYGNYFTDPENHDIKTFIASIRETQRIVSHPALQRYNAKIVDTKIPGCTQHVFDTDEYWECALRHVTATLHHQVATCKMGPAGDSEAVVDPTLKVYGIKRLRVADTSVIPLPPTAHTNVPAYMVGEKASDLIKGDWFRSRNDIEPRIFT